MRARVGEQDTRDGGEIDGERASEEGETTRPILVRIYYYYYYYRAIYTTFLTEEK